MTQYHAPLADIRFALNDVLGAASLFQRLPNFIVVGHPFVIGILAVNIDDPNVNAIECNSLVQLVEVNRIDKPCAGRNWLGRQVFAAGNRQKRKLQENQPEDPIIVFQVIDNHTLS